MNTQQKILAFLAQQEECVIATACDNVPEAAIVGFSESPSLELVIGTSSATRKYRNITKNPQVAVVIGFTGNVTVQFEGIARLLSGEELERRQKTHFKKLPEVEHFKNDPGQVYLLLSPTWVRYTDYSQPDPVEELREFA
jgi:general stress protein 26